MDVLNECHGSIQVIRHVTELHEQIDVVATADYALIPMLMYAVDDPDSGLPYANWYDPLCHQPPGAGLQPTQRLCR